jgi:hypothetical protein
MPSHPNHTAIRQSPAITITAAMVAKAICLRQRVACSSSRPLGFAILGSLRGFSSGILHQERHEPCDGYLPIQNRLKITPNRSSELNNPVIELS